MVHGEGVGSMYETIATNIHLVYKNSEEAYEFLMKLKQSSMNELKE